MQTRILVQRDIKRILSVVGRDAVMDKLISELHRGFARLGRGETEPVDPRAGHIPGALNAPTSGHTSEGRWLPAAALAERFAAIGVSPDRPVAAYCGSGVTAALEVAALAHAGLKAALFPGSWSQWSQRSELPVALGSEPGGYAVDAVPEPGTAPRSQLAG